MACIDRKHVVHSYDAVDKKTKDYYMLVVTTCVLNIICK